MKRLGLVGWGDVRVLAALPGAERLGRDDGVGIALFAAGIAAETLEEFVALGLDPFGNAAARLGPGRGRQKNAERRADGASGDGYSGVLEGLVDGHGSSGAPVVLEEWWSLVKKCVAYVAPDEHTACQVP